MFCVQIYISRLNSKYTPNFTTPDYIASSYICHDQDAPLSKRACLMFAPHKFPNETPPDPSRGIPNSRQQHLSPHIHQTRSISILRSTRLHVQQRVQYLYICRYPLSETSGCAFQSAWLILKGALLGNKCFEAWESSKLWPRCPPCSSLGFAHTNSSSIRMIYTTTLCERPYLAFQSDTNLSALVPILLPHSWPQA